MRPFWISMNNNDKDIADFMGAVLINYVLMGEDVPDLHLEQVRTLEQKILLNLQEEFPNFLVSVETRLDLFGLRPTICEDEEVSEWCEHIVEVTLSNL